MLLDIGKEDHRLDRHFHKTEQTTRPSSFLVPLPVLPLQSTQLHLVQGSSLLHLNALLIFLNFSFFRLFVAYVEDVPFFATSPKRYSVLPFLTRLHSLTCKKQIIFFLTLSLQPLLLHFFTIRNPLISLPLYPLFSSSMTALVRYLH